MVIVVGAESGGNCPEAFLFLLRVNLTCTLSPCPILDFLSFLAFLSRRGYLYLLLCLLMDGTPFASLAQIRILLVPVGTIRKSVFEKYSGLVKSIDNLRLGDIPPDSREDRSTSLVVRYASAIMSTTTDVVYLDRFVPSPLSTGSLHLRYTSHPPSAWHHSLSLLRLSSFPLAVIGIADCSQKDSHHSLAAEFQVTLTTIFSGSSATPFASKCFAFEDGDAVPDGNAGSSFPDLVMIPSLMSNKQVYIGTLLAELCHDILAEFPAIVSLALFLLAGRNQ